MAKMKRLDRVTLISIDNGKEVDLTGQTVSCSGWVDIMPTGGTLIIPDWNLEIKLNWRDALQWYPKDCGRLN